MYKLNGALRKLINRKNRARLINKDFSLLSSNCIGGFILHDLALKFNSPFINLWMSPGDYIQYLENIEYYQDKTLRFINDNSRPYPVGILEDVKIYFQHYKSEEEALDKWEKRSKRINMDNLFVIMTDRDGCTYNDLARFDSLDQYKYKVVFTNRKYPEFRSAYFIPGYENEDSVGQCWMYTSKISRKRVYDIFPYIDWFNGKNFF